MRHARKDYNHIQDPAHKIPVTEPVFLLRGQDVLAPEIVKSYAHMLRCRYGEDEQAKQLEEHADKMIQWQRNHKVKIPDLPPPFEFEDLEQES